MEGEIQLNTTFNTTDEVDIIDTFVWTDLIFTVSAVLGFTFNLTIIYVILKNEELHSRVYHYIAYFSVCFSIYLLLGPLPNAFIDDISLPRQLVCIWTDLLFTAWFAMLVFLLVLLVDWYMVTHCSRTCSSKCVRFSTFISLSVVIFVIFLLVVSIVTCSSGFFFPLAIFLTNVVSSATYLVMIALVTMHFIKMRTSNVVAVDSNVVLYILLGHFVGWCGHWVVLTLIFFDDQLIIHSQWYVSVATVSFLTPVVTFAILYRCDYTFRRCFRKRMSEAEIQLKSGRDEGMSSDVTQFQNLI